MTAKPFSLSGFLTADPAAAVESQIAKLRAKPGCRLVGVVEISRHSILEPDDEGEEPTVNLKITDLELARSTDQDELLRQAMLALHLHRTAGGTLTEDDDISLAQDTLDKLPEKVSVYESARLRAAFAALVDRVVGLGKNTRHNDGDLRRELRKLGETGLRVLSGEQLSIDGTGTLPARKAPMPAVDLEEEIAKLDDTNAPAGAPA